MRFVRLSTDEDDLYTEAMKLYNTSFPHYEQRQRSVQAQIMGDKEYLFQLIYDGNELVGIILYWETACFIYVEHFCIYPEMRNKKYGQKVLSLLNQYGKTVILEIDPPVDEISMHRKGFYERSGYHANDVEHIHPPYHTQYKGHRLVVMSSPKPLSAIEYDDFKQYLKNVVMRF